MAHDHDHTPDLAAGQNQRRLALVLTITCVVLVAEVIGAVLTGGPALLADAGHMLTDAAGLVLALIAAHLVSRPARNARTWGYQRAGTLAAAAQAVLLLGVGTYVIVEGSGASSTRQRSPPRACSSSGSSAWSATPSP